MGLIEQLQKEWPVIQQAPLSFGLLGVAIILATWAAVSWLYRNQISALKERLGLKDDRIKELEARPAPLASDNIIQGGTSVATVVAPRINLGARSVHFGQVFGGPHFDPRKEFEFRGHRLRMTGNSMETSSVNGADEEDTTIVSMSCEIISEPARWG